MLNPSKQIGIVTREAQRKENQIMNKKRRIQRAVKQNLILTGRQARRHAKQAEQIMLNRNNIMYRAYLTNGTRKSC